DFVERARPGARIGRFAVVDLFDAAEAVVDVGRSVAPRFGEARDEAAAVVFVADRPRLVVGVGYGLEVAVLVEGQGHRLPLKVGGAERRGDPERGAVYVAIDEGHVAVGIRRADEEIVLVVAELVERVAEESVTRL